MSDASPYSSPQSSLESNTQETYSPSIFSWRGRIGRLRYLCYSCIYSVIMYAALIPILGFSFVMGEADDIGSVSMILALAAYLFFIIMFVGLVRRRLHDTNASSWWGLLFLVPLINFIMALYILFKAGTRGANDYGPAPSKNHPAMWLTLLPVAIAVVGILAAVALPAYQQYVERANAASLASN